VFAGKKRMGQRGRSRLDYFFLGFESTQLAHQVQQERAQVKVQY